MDHKEITRKQEPFPCHHATDELPHANNNTEVILFQVNDDLIDSLSHKVQNDRHLSH